MTFEEMYRRMRDHEWREDWIVNIKYKYEWEKNYAHEIRVLYYDAESDNWFWDTDWNEGQTDCSVVWAIPLQDVEIEHERWIPCSERLPEIGADVLVYYTRWENSPIQIAHIMTDGLCWEFSDGEFYPSMGEVTHWMPLPMHPKKEA